MDNINSENQIETKSKPVSTSSDQDHQVGKDGKLKRPFLLLLAAFAGAVLLDLLLFNRSWGWHWAIAANLYLAAVVAGAKLEERHIPMPSATLMVLISLTSLLTGFRSAGITNASLILFSGLGMLLLTASLLNGQWLQFRLRELTWELIKLIPTGVIGAPALILEGFQASHSAKDLPGKKGGRGLAILRGVLITVPLVLVFGLLLASADTIFSEMLGSAFRWLKIDLFDTLLQHTLLILLLTWFGSAALWHALARSGKQLEIEPDKPLVKPFLGMTEAVIVLVSLNLLFATFLAVQFRYFFAGSANVNINGFTYAEYARRGFFELVVVALISGALYFGLASFTKRAEPAKKRAFSVMAALLLAQVGVMLVSAFQRLRLYEEAYGFTNARLAAHIFMVFVGLLLVAMVIMELRNAFRRLGLVLVVSVLAFALVMVAVNEDALIAKQNVDRAIAGKELDPNYLVHDLSNDAVPTLFSYIDSHTLTPALQNKLQVVMACRYAGFQEANRNTSWQSTRISTLIAGKLYAEHSELLNRVPFSFSDRGEKTVEIDGITLFCTYTPGN